MKTGKIVVFLLFIISFSFLGFLAKADTYSCSLNGNTYASSSACNADCVQSANCNLNSVSLSGSGQVAVNTTSSRSGNIIGAFDVTSNGSALNIGGVSVSLNGCGVSGSGQALVNTASSKSGDIIGTFKVVSNGATLNIGGVNVSLNGCNASGSGTVNVDVAGNKSGSVIGTFNISAAASMLTLSNSSSYQYKSNVPIVFTSSAHSCPLSGGSTCSGSPQKCTAPTTCTVNKSISGSCGSFNGQYFSSTPPTSDVTNFCSAGTFSGLWDQGSYWTWACLGINYGSTAFCMTTPPATYQCGVSSKICSSTYSYTSEQFISSTSDCLNPVGPITYSVDCSCPAVANSLTDSSLNTAVCTQATCTPTNANCAASTCQGNQCDDGCGHLIDGTKTNGVCCVANDCAANTCQGSTCNNGCATVQGTKNCSILPTGWKEVAP